MVQDYCIIIYGLVVLSHDLHPDFVRKTREFIKEFRPTLKEVNDLLSYNKIFIDRTANVGMLPIETAINYGVTGPNLRGIRIEVGYKKR